MSKRFLAMVIAVGLVVSLLPLLTTEVSAASNPYPTWQDADGDGQGELPCTRYAWQQAYDRLGVALPAWGNVIDWYWRAQNAGYPVGTTPQANSIAVWSIDTHSWGHVAFVTAVNGSNMTINEAGRTDAEWNNGIVDNQVVPSGVNSDWYGRTLIGFIYLTEAPEVSVTWDAYPDKHWIGSTNAVLAARCNMNMDNSTVSQAGLYLYDYKGNQLASKSEGVSLNGYSYFNVWFDVNSELGYTLRTGTPYQYKFMMVANGKTYYSPLYTFQTTGTHTHQYDGGAVTKEPTCTAAGEKTYTCTTCGTTKTEASGVAPGHNMGTWVVTKEPTATEEGIRSRICSICYYVEKETIPAKGYIPGDFNQDGQVTDADAIYLLRNTLFPDSYPANQDSDFNGDGLVTDLDAIYLLRHTLFPGSYPLH